jgi:hypothetical protein
MFDWRRFCRLAAVQWAENRRSWLWFLGICIAIHFCVLLLVTRGGSKPMNLTAEGQLAIYYIGYLVTGAVFAQRYFSPLSDRGSALTLLMRPASTFEKFLLAFLVVAVLYPLASTLAFQVCNVPGALLAEVSRNHLLQADPQYTYVRRQDFGPYIPFFNSRSGSADLQMMLCGSSIQALIVAGTVYFRRLAWLKTAAALFALLVLGLPLLAIATGASVAPLFWGEEIHRTAPHLRAWLVVVWAGVPALLWASVYFFLRERELQ